ncbi:MAG: flagellar hook-length control protein FliK, partial [Oribacterium sp.]|nr:flagellar hook-length control protein FliK [Oribacterium sp.]
MELVSNYFSGSAGTVTFGPGGPGYGSDSGSSGTGGIDFSNLMAEKSAADYRDTTTGSGNKTENGPSRGKDDTVKATAGQTTKQTTKEATKQTTKETQETDNSDEMKARTEEDIAALQALVSAMEADRIVSDVNTGVELAAEEDTTDLSALVSSLEADRITPDGNAGVELVTERIVTEAKAPSVTAQTKVSDDTTGPVPVMQNAVPVEDGNSVTMTERNGEDTEAVNKAVLETERNGSAVTDAKTENVVDDTKMSREEILKSLEGQGHIISNSGSYPKGEPSKDTNGPTGRPDGNNLNTEKVEIGPNVSKAKENTEKETETETETNQDPTAAIPVGFASQTQKTTVQQQELPVGTNETMMMRTTESTLTDDLTNLVSSRFPSKNGQLTIELDPENLGKITINVNYDSGHAAVSISATNSKTLEMLTQSAPQMANIIQQKTGQQTDVFVPDTQQSGTKHDMAEGRESNENREQQQSRQNEQHSRSDETSSTAFLHQMRLGLV